MVAPTSHPSTGPRRRSARSGLRWLAAGALVLGGTAGAAALGGCSGGSSDDAAATEDSAHDGHDRDAAAEGHDPEGHQGEVVMYTSPTCGCCREYAAYLRRYGYAVDVRHPDDLAAVKADAGIPDEAQACHTTMIDDYVVEGHVPIEAVDQLLTEQPDIDGIALPDMPAGSPGMGGAKDGPFDILAVDGGELSPFTAV